MYLFDILIYLYLYFNWQRSNTKYTKYTKYSKYSKYTKYVQFRWIIKHQRLQSNQPSYLNRTFKCLHRGNRDTNRTEPNQHRPVCTNVGTAFYTNVQRVCVCVCNDGGSEHVTHRSSPTFLPMWQKSSSRETNTKLRRSPVSMLRSGAADCGSGLVCCGEMRRSSRSS